MFKEAKLGQPTQQLQAAQVEGRLESRLAPYGQGIQMPGSGLPPIQMAKGVSDPEAAHLAEAILGLRQQIYFTREDYRVAQEAVAENDGKLKHLHAELEQAMQAFQSVVKQGI